MSKEIDVKKLITQSKKINAKKLITQIDDLAKSGKYSQVAIVTSHWPIFNWQTTKLRNLEGVFKHGGWVDGFVGTNEENGKLRLDIWWPRGVNKYDVFHSLHLVADQACDRDEDTVDHEFDFKCEKCNQQLPTVKS
jgi:hypothetical protein